MALSDLSFKLYNDAGLTSLFSGSLDLVHKSDLSDNPQDFTLYLGSNTANRKLQTSTSPGVNQITLTPTYAITAWTVATVMALGQSRIPTSPNGYRYQVTTAGTTHASTQPTWPTTIGSTVSDGTVVWTCVAASRAVSTITLALTSGALATNTPGAALNLGTSILNGTSNKITVYVRVVNTITTLSSTIGQPELTVNINSVVEGVV